LADATTTLARPATLHERWPLASASALARLALLPPVRPSERTGPVPCGLALDGADSEPAIRPAPQREPRSHIGIAQARGRLGPYPVLLPTPVTEPPKVLTKGIETLAALAGLGHAEANGPDEPSFAGPAQGPTLRVFAIVRPE